MPRSRSEAKLAYAVLSGKAKNSGMSMDYAKEVTDSLHARGPEPMKDLPEHATKEKGGRGIKGRLMRQSGMAIAILLLSHSITRAQGPNQGAPMRVNAFPSKEPATHLKDYTAGNMAYICLANPDAPTSGISHTWSVAASTLTNVVVSSNVGTITWPSAHGLVPGNQITISGSSTSALNATYDLASTATTTTATITTVGVADGTYTTGIVLVTNAPSEIDPLWSINYLTYDSSGNILSSTWAGGNAGTYTFKCSDRALRLPAAGGIGYK